jgi:enoyl-CoA hydratase/carnithine racemase
LARLIGPARAKDLVLTGRTVDAAEAHGMGLVDLVVPAGESVYEAALAMVRRYVDGPAQAIRAAKLAIDAGLDLPLAEALELESRLFADLFATEDRAEGMNAFVEKRKPTFTGH